MSATFMLQTRDICVYISKIYCRGRKMKKLAQRILGKAIIQQTTDIYILPIYDKYKVIFRHMNTRKVSEELDNQVAEALISHFKFIAGMNVGEKRRTQLGSCLYDLEDGRSRRLRLSSVGDFEGRESLVIRLLYDSSQKLEFWFDGSWEVEQMVVNRGRGLYLFSGPVGSGKTTLMYHLAREKYRGQQVITIEDPVELVEPEFLQLQKNDVIGSSYDELIKLSLRHMPDLVIVGEIRDEATAHAVFRASLTGYSVFSTVHAKSISGVYARLLELGLTREEIANALNGVVYQRLIAGKGLLEVVNENFENWKTTNWNRKVEKLVNDGCISTDEAKIEKVTLGKANQIDTIDQQFVHFGF